MKKTMIVVVSLFMVIMGMGGIGCSKRKASGQVEAPIPTPTPAPEQTQAVQTVIESPISTEGDEASAGGATGGEVVAGEVVASGVSASEAVVTSEGEVVAGGEEVGGATGGGAGEDGTSTGSDEVAGGGEAIPSRVWQSPSSICLDASTASQAQIGAAANGSAIVVCREGSSVYARRYSSEGIWDAAATLLDNRLSITNTPQIAMSPDGNAMAVWYQHDGTAYRIFSARYNVLTNVWGVPTVIDTSSIQPASNPKIAAGSDGSFIAVWQKSPAPGSSMALFASRILSGGSWDTALQISSVVGGYTPVSSPDIAIGSDGSAVAIWALVQDIYVNRFVPSSGWGSAAPIESSSDPARDPQIAVGPDGSAVATWIQNGSVGPAVGISNETVHVRRFDPSISGYTPPGWTPSQRPVTNNPSYVPASPQVAIDSSGNATVVWGQATYVSDVGEPVTSVWISRRSSSDGSWTNASLVEQSSASSESPQLDVDGSGNVFVVWRQGNDIVTNIFNVASGAWGTENIIDNLSPSASLPKIAVFPGGNAIAIWIQRNGIDGSIVDRVYSSIYR